MSYKSLTFKIHGTASLLMHNGQTANPLNDFSKQMKKLSSKRSKTEEDYLELARVEWFAGLYLKNKKPCIPGFIMEAVMAEAARRSKRGKLALAGIIVPDDAELIYKGPTDLNELWEDAAFRLTAAVKIKMIKVMRTRPRFDEWSAEITVKYDPRILNEEDIKDIFQVAGDVGLMDWRPRCGRFEVIE
jgi:hypothetical protein